MTDDTLQLWRVQYEDQSRDCDGTYLLAPHFVFASHVDDAWNRAEELYDVARGLPNIGVWEARPATTQEAYAWEMARAVELARLHAENEEAYENWTGQTKLTDKFMAERDALQAKIEAAPHGRECDYFKAVQFRCDCWKSRPAPTGDSK